MPTLDRPDVTSSTPEADRRRPGIQLGLTVASILKQHADSFLDRFKGRVSTHVESTLRRINFCRTDALDGRRYRCPSCQSETNLYNSCSDRHCPQCMGARRADWVDRTAKLLRPGTEYFQVVFTIPDTLSSLVLGNRKELYKLLFHASSQALQQSIRKECNMEPAMAMVLHTWNQRLGHHPHVHALVPGSGPSLDGTQWVPCRYTKGTLSKPSKPFLVDNKQLGKRFRDRYVKGIRSLVRSGKLKVTDLAALEAVLSDVSTRDWVVYIEPPPRADSDPANVIKYLGRYMTGGPISDRRLIEEKDGRIYFWARSDDKSGRLEVASLPVQEFVRRWTTHILPKRFTKSRCYGGWSNTRREAYRQQCESLSPSPIPIPTSSPTPDDTTTLADASLIEANPDRPPCPKCGTSMELLFNHHRPSWSEVFYGPANPLRSTARPESSWQGSG